MEQLLFRVRPAGITPLDSEQVYGAMPPTRARDALYGEFIVAFGSTDTLKLSAAGVTVRATMPVVLTAGLAESISLTLSAAMAGAVGVPVTEQLLLRVRPAGTVPLTSEHVYGATPPLPVIVAL
jgi:hypothetical protein